MNQKTVVFFAGSQDIKDELVLQEVETQLRSFMEENKQNIDKILYGSGTYGVMGMVHNVAQEVGITIEGYSIERYRKYDEGNGVDVTFFPDDDIRMQEFSKDGDVFVALPGGKGTVKEVLGISDMILEAKQDKTIYVPGVFTALFNLFSDLKKSGMMFGDDMKVINTVDSLKDVKL